MQNSVFERNFTNLKKKKTKNKKRYGVEWGDVELKEFWKDLMKTEPTKLQLKMMANVCCFCLGFVVFVCLWDPRI